MGSGNIHEKWLYCKNLLDDVLADWGLIIIVILLGLGSFGLGRLSALEDVKKPVSVHKTALTASVAPMVAGGYVVASRSGSTYYFPWCGGATSIAAQNQVWFKNEEAAKKAGYRPAKNCKGLE